jgi:hypothetical protein
MRIVVGQLAVVLLISMLHTCEAAAPMDEVQLHCKKQQYISGEPVLLRTTVTNVRGKNFVGELDSGGRQGSYCLGGAFSFYVALDSDDFRDILGTGTARPAFPVTVPPVQVEYWRDRRCIPGTLEIGQSKTRVDMLVFSLGGTYRVKAVFKNKDGTTRIASAPVEFRVAPLARADEKIAKIANEDLLTRLGKAIYSEYYEEGVASLDQDVDIRTLASEITKNYRDSAFAEYISASRLLAYTPGRQEPSELSDDERKAAEEFLVEHPKSWLLPGLYRKLFWTYISENDRPNAERIMALATQTAPHDTVLNDVQEAGPAKLGRISGTAPMPPAQTENSHSYMVMLPLIALAGISGIGIWYTVARAKHRGKHS